MCRLTDLFDSPAWAWIIVLLLAGFGLFGLPGCTAYQLAAQGPGSRGPAELSLTKNPDGSLASLSGKTAGGGNSVLHYQRDTTVAPDGTKNEHVIATSDPTLVLQTFYSGVAQQSTLDSQHFAAALGTISSTLQQWVPIAMNTAQDLKALRAESAQEREDRLAREAKRDERLDRTLTMFENWLATQANE